LAALEARAAGETLRLAEPAQAVLGPDGGVRVPGLALALGRGGRARAEGHWGPERADLRVGLSALPLAVAEPFAPGVEPQGTLSGEVRVTGPVSRPGVRAELRGTGIKAGADWARGLPVLSLRAEGTLAGEAAQARAEIDAGRAGRLTATARLPGGFGPRAPLAAAARRRPGPRAPRRAFLAAGANRRPGRLPWRCGRRATVGEPRLGGRATLSNGDFRNVALRGARQRSRVASSPARGTRLVVEALAGPDAGQWNGRAARQPGRGRARQSRPDRR
jgi:translocation and assembly module TamB